MSLSGQLPLTAFYKSASSQSRSTKPSVSKSALKRRDALARAQDATSSKKRQRHKENRDFAARGSLQSLNDRSDKQSGSLHDGKADPPHPAASIVRHEDIIDLTDTTAPAIKAPSTPIVHTGDRRLITAASLPSPPLTASDAKRIRGPRDGTDTARCLHTPDPHLNDPSLASATDAVAVGHKDSIVLFPPHKGGKTSMPPPPLPLKASSFSMPSRRTFRSPPSRSSDDWVPSSQPHETSIPRPERSNDGAPSENAPYTPVDQSSQIVPSSQSNERELSIPDGHMTTSDVPRAFDSTLFPPNSSTFPSPIDTEDRLNSPQDGPIVELPSTFVESSQSQFEHDLTASHAEMMDARRTALLWGKEEDPSSVPSSSPPRPAESQDYDANDEYSQSQDVPSQPSTFAPSQLYGSPSRSSSQSGSYQGMSYPRTPSQLRHFTDMFRNRDEFGNELPEKPVENGGGTTRSRSMSPSPSSRKKPRLEDLRADTSRTDNPSPYDFLPTSQRSPRHDSDSLEGTSGSPPASQSLVDGYNDGSSSSQELPSAMRDFLAMFDGSQPSQLAFL